MTIHTIRGSTGRVRNMFLVASNIITSSDIAFYVAATHGGKDIAVQILQNEREAAWIALGMYLGDILAELAIQGYQIKQINKKSKELYKQVKLSSFKYVAKSLAVDSIGWAWLTPAWFDFFMFIIGATSSLQISLESDPEPDINCWWDDVKEESF